MSIESSAIQVPSSSKEGAFLSAQYCSAGDTPVAIALMFHGITSDRDEWGFYSRMSDKLAANNISSVRLDFRGHGASDWPTDDLSLTGFQSDIDSTYEAVKHLVSLDDVPVFLVGTSFGGGLTLQWAMDHASNVSGLFLCAPVLDYFEDIKEYTEAIANDPSFLLYGGEMKLPSYLLDESRNYRLNSLKTPSNFPVTIFHGDKDVDVPFSSSSKFQNANPTVELITIPNSGHGFAAPDDEELEFSETLENHELVYNSMVTRINEWRVR